MKTVLNIQQANIDNLTDFWQTASRPFNAFHSTDDFDYCEISHSEWPNRLWFNEPITLKSIEHAREQIQSLSSKITVPYWDLNNKDEHILLEKNGFSLLFEQLAMYMPLKAPMAFEGPLTIKRITEENEIEQWAAIYPDAFGYVIGKEILSKTSNIIHYYLASYNDKPIGTAMLHYTGDIAGIHGVGVIPDMRKKGFAEQIMNYIVNEAIMNKAETAVLQASAMGKNIYTRLGFKDLFVIKNYQ